MPFEKGHSGNPGGRPKDSPQLKKAKEALADRLAPKAIDTLEELLTCDENKVRATVALGIVKATIGELSRQAGPDGEPVDNRLTEMTAEMLAEFGLWRAERMKKP